MLTLGESDYLLELMKQDLKHHIEMIEKIQERLELQQYPVSKIHPPMNDSMFDELLLIVKRIDDSWDCPKAKLEESCYGGSCCVCIVECAIQEFRSVNKSDN
jgi:hypothetical protein